MTANVDLDGVTDIGRVRSSNQDAFCARAGDDVPPAIDALVAVADGMGGTPAGDVASAIAIQGVIEGVSLDLAGVETATAEELAETLSRVLQNINAKVYQASLEPGRRGMGTTLTVAVVAGATVVAGNVGDSRAYVYVGGRLRQFTSDHSWVEEQVSAGLLTREQAERHANRNMLTRAVGTSPESRVDTFATTLDSGDGVVLCSDGLYRLVGDEEIERTMASAGPQQACQDLVDLANARGGVDNVTVVIVRLAL